MRDGVAIREVVRPVSLLLLKGQWKLNRRGKCHRGKSRVYPKRVQVDSPSHRRPHHQCFSNHMLPSQDLAEPLIKFIYFNPRETVGEYSLKQSGLGHKALRSFFTQTPTGWYTCPVLQKAKFAYCLQKTYIYLRITQENKISGKY